MEMVLLVAVVITPMMVSLLLHGTRFWWLIAGLLYLVACGLFAVADHGHDGIVALLLGIYATLIWGATALVRYLSLRRPGGTRSSAPAGHRTRARRRSPDT